MLVVPISFVTEHIETLHEINIEARTEAKNLGIVTFRMMPAVGDSPLFIAALKDLVLRAVGMETEPAGVTASLGNSSGTNDLRKGFNTDGGGITREPIGAA